MTLDATVLSATQLVDKERGLISRDIFVNPELYKLEQERVFARAWLFVGLEDQVRKPGDYFVSRMGEESVILSRDRDNTVHVFLNSCRHRGMKVCRYDEGNTPVFTCPYHGWSYAGDGSAGWCSPVQGRVPGGAGQVAMGVGGSRADGQLQGDHLGDVGPRERRRSMDYLGDDEDRTWTFGRTNRDGSRRAGPEAIPRCTKVDLRRANWKFGAENRASATGYHNTESPLGGPRGHWS